MPNLTPNYNLKKPLQTENYNIDDANGNMDIVDVEFKKANDKLLDYASHKNSLVTDVGGVHGIFYEEGLWTPILKGSTVAGNNTYIATGGNYIKINKQVTCWFRMVMSVKDVAMAGALYIDGLPFVALNLNTNRGALSISGVNLLDIPIGKTQIVAEVHPGGTTLDFRAIGDNNSYATLDNTAVSNGFDIAGSFTYISSI